MPLQPMELSNIPELEERFREALADIEADISRRPGLAKGRKITIDFTFVPALSENARGVSTIKHGSGYTLKVKLPPRAPVTFMGAVRDGSIMVDPDANATDAPGQMKIMEMPGVMPESAAR